MGAFAFTGAFAAVAGATFTVPACTVLTDWCVDCLSGDGFPPAVVAVEPPGDCVAPPLSHEASTHTGALALIGASTDWLGSAATEPTWTVPSEPPVDWPSANAGPAVVAKTAAVHAPRMSRRLFTIVLLSRQELGSARTGVPNCSARQDLSGAFERDDRRPRTPVRLPCGKEARTRER
jgi:hypothetical protein